MACQNVGLRPEGKTRNSAAAPSSSPVGDALLFATMCIIGMPVDVYAKDGSVYSGIFHTTSVDNNYAIVLKKARMIENGNLEVNVKSGSFIETLIVQWEDLVQVVAKNVLLPSNGIAGSAGDGSIEAAVGCNACPDKDVEVINTNERKGNKKQMSHNRYSAKKDNDFPGSTAKATTNHLGSSSEEHVERLDTRKVVEIEEVHDVSVDKRNSAVDGSRTIQINIHKNPESDDQSIMTEVQGTSISINNGEASSITVNREGPTQQEQETVSSVRSDPAEDQGRQRLTFDETSCTVSSLSNVSLVSSPMFDAKSNSCLKASSNPFVFVPPKSSSFNRPAQDSKLNPGAKIFSPSLLQHRTVSPSVANVGSVPYIPSTYTVAAPQEVEASSFNHSSVAVKLFPYNNIVGGHGGHGGHDASYVQPLLGHVMNRMQPARFTGQYQNFQMGPPYVHPNPQNVMLGRMAAPLVCMHPMPTDVVQSAAGFSPSVTRPVFAKHQGNASAQQALQLCMNPPPIMGNGAHAQQFVMPSAVPLSQPVFPVLHPPIAVQGTTGFLSTKYGA